MTISRKNNSPSIRTSIAVWTSVSLLVVGVVMVVANMHILSAPIEKHLDQLTQDVAYELVKHLTEAVWNMDDQAISHHLVDYPGESVGLVAVKVTTEFDDVLFERKYSDESAPFMHKAPVLHGAKIIGYVEVRLDGHHLLSTRHAILRSGFVIVALSILVIIMVCAFIVNTIVIRPVEQTVAGLRMIASGNYGHKLRRETTAEIDSINQEINAMADDIFRRQKMLQSAIETRELAENNLRDLNEDLEGRISDRTAQLRRLAKMLASAQDHEQKRIAEGLHDDVAQLLAACRMKIAAASKHAAGTECVVMMEEIDDLVGQAYERLRLLSFELASSTLYQWGLKDSLMKLCSGMNDRYNTDFEIIGKDDLTEFSETSAAVLFKAVRELLFNVVKHSGVMAATVKVERMGSNLVLTVEDAGSGFGSDIDIGAGRGMGLFSIKERLQDIDGEMKIDSEEGVRTRVILTVPWLRKDADE